MTPPTFATEQRRLQQGTRNYRPVFSAYVGAQQQTRRRTPLLPSIDGQTDGQVAGRMERWTDARPFHKSCSAY